MQELVWTLCANLIIETSIAHGGSLILSAYLLALLDLCEATESGEMLDTRAAAQCASYRHRHPRPQPRRHRSASTCWPDRFDPRFFDRSPGFVLQVHDAANGAKRVPVSLASNHTHYQVPKELRAYAPRVTPGSYCTVFDTEVEDLPAEMHADRL